MYVYNTRVRLSRGLYYFFIFSMAAYTRNYSNFITINFQNSHFFMAYFRERLMVGRGLILRGYGMHTRPKSLECFKNVDFFSCNAVSTF